MATKAEPGFAGDASGKKLPANVGDVGGLPANVGDVRGLPANVGDVKRLGFSLWAGKIPWRMRWQPTLVFLPGESHGQRSQVGLQYMGSQRVGHDRSHQTHTHTHTG